MPFGGFSIDFIYVYCIPPPSCLWGFFVAALSIRAGGC